MWALDPPAYFTAGSKTLQQYENDAEIADGAGDASSRGERAAGFLSYNNSVDAAVAAAAADHARRKGRPMADLHK